MFRCKADWTLLADTHLCDRKRSLTESIPSTELCPEKIKNKYAKIISFRRYQVAIITGCTLLFEKNALTRTKWKWFLKSKDYYLISYLDSGHCDLTNLVVLKDSPASAVERLVKFPCRKSRGKINKSVTKVWCLLRLPVLATKCA